MYISLHPPITFVSCSLAAGHQLLGGTAEARIANLPMGALGEEDDQDDGFFNVSSPKPKSALCSQKGAKL